MLRPRTHEHGRTHTRSTRPDDARRKQGGAPTMDHRITDHRALRKQRRAPMACAQAHDRPGAARRRRAHDGRIGERPRVAHHRVVAAGDHLSAECSTAGGMASSPRRAADGLRPSATSRRGPWQSTPVASPRAARRRPRGTSLRCRCAGPPRQANHTLRL